MAVTYTPKCWACAVLIYHVTLLSRPLGPRANDDRKKTPLYSWDLDTQGRFPIKNTVTFVFWAYIRF